MPDPSPSTLTIFNSNFLQLGRRSGGRPQRAVHPYAVSCVNTVIHTLVGLEPATFRSLVRRATNSATEVPDSSLGTTSPVHRALLPDACMTKPGIPARNKQTSSSFLSVQPLSRQQFFCDVCRQLGGILPPDISRVLEHIATKFQSLSHVLGSNFLMVILPVSRDVDIRQKSRWRSPK